MDKLRALQYFVAAAEEHSFSGAARRFSVSIPAVAKLVASLERSLGATLFERNARGLILTTDGLRYLQVCQPPLDELAAIDEVVSGAAARPRGSLVVGAPAVISRHCIVPALPRFHARYPDIQIDIRVVNRLTEQEAYAVDVFVLLGWPDHPDFVQKRIGQTRFAVCGAPAYWAAHGKPQCPRDLERYVCLLLRSPEGAVLDLWEFQRGEEKQSVAVSGWLVSSHQDVLLDAMVAGEGVARMTNLAIRTHLEAGRLVPVLLDWDLNQAPPVEILFRPNHRRTPRVRLFVDFVIDLFRKLEEERVGGITPIAAERPSWYRRRYERASTALREDTKRRS